jgi:hypothetical protein
MFYFEALQEQMTLVRVKLFGCIVDLWCINDRWITVYGRRSSLYAAPFSHRITNLIGLTSTATITAHRDLSERLANGAVYHYKVCVQATRKCDALHVAKVRAP